jgi:hypothetical protein
VSDSEIDMVTSVLTRIRANLTGKTETVVPFAGPKSAPARSGRKTHQRTTKTSVRQGIAS